MRDRTRTAVLGAKLLLAVGACLFALATLLSPVAVRAAPTAATERPEGSFGPCR